MSAFRLFLNRYIIELLPLCEQGQQLFFVLLCRFFFFLFFFLFFFFVCLFVCFFGKLNIDQHCVFVSFAENPNDTISIIVIFNNIF